MFTPEEKEIYKFHDGKKERAVDPLKFQRRLEEKHLDVAKEYGLMQHFNLSAFGRVAEAVSHAAGIPMFDDEHPDGWTETQLVALCSDFFLWCENVAKKNGTKLSGSAATDSHPDTDSTTKLGLDSTSTENELICNEPMPSQ